MVAFKIAKEPCARSAAINDISIRRKHNGVHNRKGEWMMPVQHIRCLFVVSLSLLSVSKRLHAIALYARVCKRNGAFPFTQVTPLV
jgi:hypothetical protein